MNIIGLDIGGTKCALSVPDGPERVREVVRFATTDVHGTLDRLFREIARLAPPPDTVFGVSCGGPLDSGQGLILSPPNLPGWDRIAICARLTERFGGRAFLMNDANACALAEWQFGAGRGCRSLLFLTMGTGMGAGLILDGRLYEGVTGNAGEVGHLRLAPAGPVGYGKAGSFEGFCSGGGIAQLARQRVAEFTGVSALRSLAADQLTAREVGVAAEAGDALARAIWHEVGERLGEALALLIDRGPGDARGDRARGAARQRAGLHDRAGHAGRPDRRLRRRRHRPLSRGAIRGLGGPRGVRGLIIPRKIRPPRLFCE
ncbi:MAG: ROK family protein [Opitutales bacterium]|nr:ROK family protein [Opitutales bacterium]